MAVTQLQAARRFRIKSAPFRRATFGRVEERLIKLRSSLAVPHSGAIAQLGERIVRNDEVVGSSPTSSTNLFKRLPSFSPLLNTKKPALLHRFVP